MISKITIDGKEYKTTLKGVTARLYREQFRSDLLVDMNNAQKNPVQAIAENMESKKFAQGEIGDLMLSAIGETFLTQLAWACIAGELLLTNKPVPTYVALTDNIEDYVGFIQQCCLLYDSAIFSSQPTVESEDTEEPKKKVKRTSQKSLSQV